MRLTDTDDVVNSVVAGLGTGLLYRATVGVRSAAVAGAIDGVVVGFQKEDQDFPACSSSIWEGEKD